MLHLPSEKKRKVLVAVFDLADPDQQAEYETLINTERVEIIEETQSITPKGRIVTVVKYTIRQQDLPFKL